MNKPLHKPAQPAMGRRRFLGVSSLALLAGAAALSGCKKDDEDEAAPTAPSDNDPNLPEINLTNDDTGRLNLLYLVEQLQAGFLEQVSAGFAAGFSATEQELFVQMRDQQRAHRALLKSLLGTDAITDATLNFSAADLSSRSSVLSYAQKFTDLAESAYNGVAEYFTTADRVLLLAKMASAESRQAAFVRSLVQSGSFASPDAVDANGLSRLRKPSAVLVQLDPFIRNKTTSALA